MYTEPNLASGIVVMSQTKLAGTRLQVPEVTTETFKCENSILVSNSARVIMKGSKGTITKNVEWRGTRSILNSVLFTLVLGNKSLLGYESRYCK